MCGSFKKEVDLLIVAGDIFDIGNPPSYARTLYYQFLTPASYERIQQLYLYNY